MRISPVYIIPVGPCYRKFSGCYGKFTGFPPLKEMYENISHSMDVTGVILRDKVIFSQGPVCSGGGVCIRGYGQQTGGTHHTGMHSCMLGAGGNIHTGCLGILHREWLNRRQRPHQVIRSQGKKHTKLLFSFHRFYFSAHICSVFTQFN